jgi:hypothetical protein
MSVAFVRQGKILLATAPRAVPIVCLDWGGGLLVAYLIKEGSTWYGFVCIDVDVEHAKLI